MTQILAILSGKGGTGKSTVACGLAQAMTRQKRNVLLLDGAQGLRSLDLMLGVPDGILYNIVDLAKGRCSAEEALTEIEGYDDRLWLLAADPTMKSGQDLTRSYTRAVERIRVENERKDSEIPVFDEIVLDCGGGWDAQLELAGLADQVLLVETPDPVSLRAADKLRGAFEKEPYLLLNQIPDTGLAENGPNSLEQIKELLPIPIVGLIRKSEALRQASESEESVDLAAAEPEFSGILERLRDLREKRPNGLLKKLFGRG